MRTDSSSSISSASGANTVSLSYQAIAAGHRTASEIASRKTGGAIEDLLETSDRDADGRSSHESDLPEPTPPRKTEGYPSPQTGSRLDLTG